MNRAFYKASVFAIIVLAIAGVTVFLVTQKKSEILVPKIEEKKTGKPISKIIGYSEEGRKIKSYTYGNGKKEVVFVGGIHGGYEWNSVMLAYKLMDYFEAYPSVIPDNLSITIIPSANPDGVYKVVGKEGRFTIDDVPTDKAVLASGRFNANKVDINRNFDCKWSEKSTWQNKTVSGGTSAFSEPEAQAIRDYAISMRPIAFVFWHSQANGVFASECGEGILPETTKIMNVYADASGYPAQKSFDGYAITGDSTDWLASVGIPAISIELKTHEDIEWENNLAGVKALLEYYK